MTIKTVFHIDEEEKWKLVLGNVKNLLAEAPDAEIEVIANSVAVRGYQSPDSHLPGAMQELAAKNIRFCACNNSLKGLKMEPEQLPDFVVIVPAGVKEIAEKQHDGFAYIKP